MRLIESILADAAAITTLRRDIHAHPELCFEEQRTADLIAKALTDWGIPIHRGMGKTGVVGIVKNGTSKRAVGLRADIDALPMTERNTFAHASRHAGRMHACGHDGHTAMLLGAARYLAETRNFAGTAVVVFQPAEEGGGGGKEMVDHGLMDQFGIREVYGMHNYPGMPVGTFGIRPGAMMAAADALTIDIEGVGAHAARPHLGIDTVLVGAQIINAILSYALTGERMFLGHFEQAPGCVNVLDIGDEWIVRAVNVAPLDLLHASTRMTTMEGYWTELQPFLHLLGNE